VADPLSRETLEGRRVGAAVEEGMKQTKLVAALVGQTEVPPRGRRSREPRTASQPIPAVGETKATKAVAMRVLHETPVASCGWTSCVSPTAGEEGATIESRGRWGSEPPPGSGVRRAGPGAEAGAAR
jgi:hypothetical protein